MKRKEETEILTYLFPFEDGKECERKLNKKRKKTTIAVFVIGIFLSIAMGVSEIREARLSAGELPRESYEGEERDYFLIAKDEKTGHIEEVKYTLSPIEYSNAELELFFEKAQEKLWETIRGENTEIENIQTNLTLIQKMNEYPFSMRWETSHPDILSGEGKICEKEVPEDGICVTLTCFFSYQKWKRQLEFPVFVRRRERTSDEKWKDEIQSALLKSDNMTKEERTLPLPKTVQNREVSWRLQQGGRGYAIAVLTVFASVCVYLSYERDLEKKKHNREKELRDSYSLFVNHFALLVGAGMTVPRAFEKIDKTYFRKEECKAVYQEIHILCKELENGISENKAYEHFASRCGVNAYARLASILSQNSKKGNAGLLKELKEEVRMAEETRQTEAKKKGEEIGNKLLVPMVCNLLIVLITIMAPAFLSFTV